MKRDMDLVRQILIELEAFDPLPHGYHSIAISKFNCASDYPHDVIGGHLRMMHDAGLYTTYQNRANWRQFNGLSWKGYDFLDAVRDDEVWRLTKEGVREVGGYTFELLSELAKGYLRTKIKQHTGVEI